jgi:hypothetical protein
MTHHALRLLRKVHLYFGLLISPALFFFAFTGAMQTFSLHESVPGSSYKPARWEMELAQIHKNQTTEISAHHAHPEAKSASPVPDTPSGDAAAQPANGAHHHQHDTSLASPSADATTATTLTNNQPESSTGPTKRQKHLPLKIFFLLVSVGLFTSTLTGLCMAYKYTRNKWAVTAWWVSGTILPLLLLKL